MMVASLVADKFWFVMSADALWAPQKSRKALLFTEMMNTARYCVLSVKQDHGS